MIGCFGGWNLFRAGPTNPRAKALLIGINYVSDSEKYRSIKNVNDVVRLKDLIVNRKYFDEKDITVMSDIFDKTDPTFATTSNIFAQLDKLLAYANESTEKTTLLISFSGQTVCVTGARKVYELDNEDQVISQALCTSDGIITKYDLFDNFINKLPASTNVFMLIDSYSTEPFCELKYRYNCDHKDSYTIRNRQIPTMCSCIILSGCKYNNYLMDLLDSGTSDREDGGYYGDGAMTDAFLDIYNEHISIKNLVLGIKQWFHKNNLKQIPNVSSSRLLPINKIIMGSILKTKSAN